MAALFLYPCSAAIGVAGAKSGSAGGCCGGIAVCGTGGLWCAGTTYAVYGDGSCGCAVVRPHDERVACLVHGTGRGRIVRSLGRVGAWILAFIRRCRHHSVHLGRPCARQFR